MGKLLPASALLLSLSLVSAIPGPKHKDATAQGGNQATSTYNLKGVTIGSNDNLYLSNQQGLTGGNTRVGRDVHAFYLRSAEPEFIYQRDAFADADPEAYPGFLSGGDSKGGSSTTKGGNHNNNSPNFKGMSVGNGATFSQGNMQTNKGGNVRGGNGGVNGGSGGSGGALSIPMPPMPLPERRDLFAREAYADADAEAYPGGFMSGGDAKGGSSTSKGGNHNNNSPNFKGMKIGSDTSFSVGNMQSNVGGNVRGGNGGANSGNGGGGGSLSIPMPPMPLPARRDIHVRDAYAHAEAEAEASLEERDAIPDAWAEHYSQIYTRDAYAAAVAEVEADLRARDAEAYYYY
ncbi:MAG: hypothetical protein MMC33_010695 [Icmadophila ericetorum]|nr:hypothetical protein [Icmadophila ericetorum]